MNAEFSSTLRRQMDAFNNDPPGDSLQVIYCLYIFLSVRFFLLGRTCLRESFAFIWRHLRAIFDRVRLSAPPPFTRRVSQAYDVALSAERSVTRRSRSLLVAGQGLCVSPLFWSPLWRSSWNLKRTYCSYFVSKITCCL